MIWLFIFLAVCLVLGPLLVLLPTPRQREQQAFRKQARAEGLRVELCQLDDPDPDPELYLSATGQPLEPKIRCIAYRKHRLHSDHGQHRHAITWRIVRKRSGHTDGLPLTWHRLDLHGTDRPHHLFARLALALPLLPVDVLCVEEVNDTVSVYWREIGGEEALARVFAFLHTIAGLDPSDPDAPAGAG